MVFRVPWPSNSTVQMDLCQANNSMSIWRRLLYLIHALKGTAESRRPFCFISWRWVKRNPSPSSRWVTDIVLFMRRFYISKVVQMLFFFHQRYCLKCSTSFHVKRLQMAWHLAEEGHSVVTWEGQKMSSAFNKWVAICHWWPHITTACLKMTYHNFLPDLQKPPLLKMLCAFFFGVPRNLNPKHTSIQAPSKIPSAGRFLWAALVIISGDKLCKWQSFRSFFPKIFKLEIPTCNNAKE